MMACGFIGSMDGESPAFVFDSTGTYQVMLTVADANGCADTLVQQVNVNPAPVSAFSYTENVENIQGQVQFTNGTIGASEYFWDFGNGAVSYAESPLITYADDGIYNVILVSVSEQGCHDTTMITYEMMFKGLVRAQCHGTGRNHSGYPHLETGGRKPGHLHRRNLQQPRHVAVEKLAAG